MVYSDSIVEQHNSIGVFWLNIGEGNIGWVDDYNQVQWLIQGVYISHQEENQCYFCDQTLDSHDIVCWPVEMNYTEN